MTANCMRCLGVALLVAIGWCSAAKAVPVEIQYTGVVNFTQANPGPAIANGTTITLDVFADNGGTSIDSQFWSVTNITSTTITVGSYSATASGALVGGGVSVGSFSTNASGQLSSLFLEYVQFGTDNCASCGFNRFAVTLGTFDTGIWSAFQPSPAEGFFEIFAAAGANDLSADGPINTTISLVSSATPLPAALPLFATGLAGLGLLGWRRKRKAQAV